MNQLVAAWVAFFLALTLLGFRRKPRNLFSTKFSEDISLQSLSLVIQSGGSDKENRGDESFNLLLPRTAQEKLLFRKKLKNLIESGPEDRLLAVNTAQEWGDPSVLPILRIGLRDSDSRVVIKSAQAISKFRGCPKVLKRKNSMSYPRNVSRMR